MSSEEANSSEVSAFPPTVQELEENFGLRLSRFVSRIIRNSPRYTQQDSDRRARVIIFNASTGNIIVIEDPSNLDSVIQELAGKSGVPPATKDSIESLPRVVVTEESTDCSICLEDYEVGSEAREMPCKHIFHPACIEKWLEIHGTCPLCRFLMPMKKVENNVSSAAEENRNEGLDIDDETAEDTDERLEIDEIAEGITSIRLRVRIRRGGDPMDLDRELVPSFEHTNSDSQHENSGSGAHDSSMIQDMES